MVALFETEAALRSESIEPWRLTHAEFLVECLGDLGGKRVLDVGCGAGRFASFVKERNRDVSIWGVDVSLQSLRLVPGFVNTQAAWMTALPFRDGFFDTAYAIESLEHAVEIDSAIREICRVVKRGGKIVIIDKNAAEAGRVPMPYWEQWFDRRELERMLGGWCTSVSSQSLAHIEPDDPLFIGWVAQK